MQIEYLYGKKMDVGLKNFILKNGPFQSSVRNLITILKELIIFKKYHQKNRFSILKCCCFH